MSSRSAVFVCGSCGATSPKWTGRCGGCGAWGTLAERPPGPEVTAVAGATSALADPDDEGERRLATGLEDLDRVLGGGLVTGSVILLAGEPGIGKSTLLLHVLGAMSAAGVPSLLASGEETRGQVAARARRLGIDTSRIGFVAGRELEPVLGAALDGRPSILAVDSIQTIRDPRAAHVPGGVAQVRAATDALVGLAKHTGISVVLTGHVTKDGELAGPRALEHAVDVVVSFDGDPRSGLRVLAAGKNRFGAEGETAWFEMGAGGLSPVDPALALRGGSGLAGASTALIQRGRRALAAEVQALVGPADGAGRRHVTGLDPRRFQLVAAVLDRTMGLGLGRADLYGAAPGGIRIDEPGADLAVAAAIASAASGVAPPLETAFLGEVALTGSIRPVPAAAARLAAARTAGCRVVVGPPELEDRAEGLRIEPVRVVHEALTWCAIGDAGHLRSLPA